MKKVKFIGLIEDLVELPSGSLVESSVLSDLMGWDSMAIMSFINLMDEEFNISPNPKSIVACKTVRDLMTLVGTALED